MQIQLDSDQTAELAQRSSDVDEMLSILIGERRSATRESAFLAWSKHSDSSAASWLIMDRRDDVVAAHDQMVISDLSRRADQVVSSQGVEEIHAFVKDYVGQVSTDPEDQEILALVGIGERGEKDVPLSIMRQWGSEDMGLVEAIAERFDLELPTDFERSCRRDNLMTMLRMTIVDRDGFAC
jgi:hypothetical protein